MNTDSWPEELAIISRAYIRNERLEMVVDMNGGSSVVTTTKQIENPESLVGKTCVVGVEPPGTGSPLIIFKRFYNVRI